MIFITWMVSTTTAGLVRHPILWAPLISVIIWWIICERANLLLVDHFVQFK